jgi:hypothetical protein
MSNTSVADEASAANKKQVDKIPAAKLQKNPRSSLWSILTLPSGVAGSHGCRNRASHDAKTASNLNPTSDWRIAFLADDAEVDFTRQSRDRRASALRA